MKRFFAFLTLATLLLCSGCALAQTGAQVTIGMYGDSTMAGWTDETGTAIITPRNDPAQLQNMLTTAGYNVVVNNHGAFGATSSDLVNGTRSVTIPWTQQMAQSTESIIVINIGLNDAIDVTNGSETWQQFVANWQTLISVAQAAGKQVFIETMNPRTDDNGAYENNCLWLSVHELTLEQNTPNVGWIDEYTAITDRFANWQAHLPDGIHPDDTLYAFKASVEIGILTPYLNLTSALPPGYTPTAAAAAKLAAVPPAPK